MASEGGEVRTWEERDSARELVWALYCVMHGLFDWESWFAAGSFYLGNKYHDI